MRISTVSAAALRAVALGWFLTLAAALTAHAQLGFDLDTERVEQQQRADELAAIESELAEPGIEEGRLAELRDQLRDLRTAARGVAARVAGPREDVVRSLDALGPAPAADGEPEADDIASDRAQLRARQSALDAVAAQAALVIERTTILIDRVNVHRRGVQLDELLARGPSPFSPSIWPGDAQSFFGGVQSLADAVSAWGETDADGRGWVQIGAALAAALAVIALITIGAQALVGWIERFAVNLIGARPAGLIAAMRTLAAVIVGVTAAVIIISAAIIAEIYSSQNAAFFAAIARGAVVVFLAIGVCEALFRTTRSSNRLLPLSAPRKRVLRLIFVTAGLIYALDGVMREGAVWLGGDGALALAQTTVASVLIVALIFWGTRSALWTIEGEDGEAARVVAPRLGWLARIAAIIAIGALVLGYSALCEFILDRVFIAALAIGVLVTLRAALRDIASEARLIASRHRAQQSEDGPVAFWIAFFIDFVLFLIAAPAALVIIGVEWDVVRDWAERALFGVRVGGVTISAANILAGVAMFAAALFATRLIQSNLRRRVYPRTRMDPSVQNSLTTLMGYAGLCVAVVIGLGAAGFNFSQVALIAGALSVGVGFGLQAIVNNFVSGLILLFERPVKVGDWIVLPEGEGVVRKISVRSTMIETWDRASIIVPNSSLINGTVRNWTHTNRIARIDIPVGVSYASDPELVRDILLKCAADQPNILSDPATYVYWKDFGASSLDFELRAFIANATDGLSTKTALRFAIFKALKEAGVEIPFPQHDVHLYPTGGDKRGGGDAGGEGGADSGAR